MLTDTIHAATNTLRYATATLRMQRAAAALLDALKRNAHWHYQPRVPPGTPEGGQWTKVSFGKTILKRILSAAAAAKLRAEVKRNKDFLRRSPKRWKRGDTFPADDKFDKETGRIGPATARRPEHPVLRFKDEDELRRYLGPAGEDREWHHIVEKRLAENGTFPAELIHSTDNIINLPRRVHIQVTSRMNSSIDGPGTPRLRYDVGHRSFEEQYNIGLRLIKHFYKDFSTGGGGGY